MKSTQKKIKKIATRKSITLTNKISTFAGAFNDMSAKEYSSFIKETKKTRTKLFNR